MILINIFNKNYKGYLILLNKKKIYNMIISYQNNKNQMIKKLLIIIKMN